MKTEVEMGGMRPQAQGRLETPGAGRGRQDPPLEPPEGVRPWDTLTSDVWSPGLREDRFLLLWASVYGRLSQLPWEANAAGEQLPALI